ncbi:MAG: hypothetical protein ABEI27_05065 [Halobellus sp.]|uniref:hypothetical protein n=1 Tax=Halobellus sp. TaxID=1979212 RepID=UPI0035D3EA0A
MEFDTGRRRFLELTGVGAAATLAGCNTGQTEQTEGSTATNGDASTAAAAVEPDQQKLQERESEIRSELDSGNISQTEAREQYREAQSQLRQEAITAFEAQATEAGISIEGSVDQFGIVLVNGPAAALIEALYFDQVTALFPESTFEQAQSQAQTQTATATSSG